jgi:tetratricopeptide (TPR) repeat protein
VPTFVGREPDLLAIAAALKVGQTTAIGQAASVHGLGGVGKTTVATEFVHRYGGYFAGGVFWLSFADPANIPAEIAQCGGEGGLHLRPDFHNLPLPDQVAAVQRAWQEELPRLLIFDNVDTDDGEALVAQWRPTTGGARVLITSRRGVWSTDLGIAALPLGTLPRAESINLLRQFRADLSDADADAVAAELGDLPLALHLAGSFLKKYATTREGDPAAFLARLRDPALLEHPALQGRATGAAWSYQERSVARAFALSYERLTPDDATDALALALLARAAHFAPGETIPRELLLATIDSNDELLVMDALERLIALGLLESSQAEKHFQIHRLLNRFIKENLNVDEAQRGVESMLLAASREIIDREDQMAIFGIRKHLLSVTDAAFVRQDEMCAGLGQTCALSLGITGDYTQAKKYVEHALRIRELLLDANHPDILESLNTLGLLCRNLGEYELAEKLLERALVARESILGEDNPSTADTLYNLAALYFEKGSYRKSRNICQRVLTIREKNFDYREWARVLNQLASVLHVEGNYSEAQDKYELALELQRQEFGSDHPYTAQSLTNLANLWRDQGRYQEAEGLYEEALACWKKLGNSDYPELVQIYSNLAGVYYALKRYDEALGLIEESLRITTKAFGETHPYTAATLTNMGTLLFKQGKYDRAESLYNRALAVQKQTLGTDHPDVALSLHVLADLWFTQERYTESQQLYEQALATRRKFFGADNPRVAHTLNNLAAVFEMQGSLEDAFMHYTEALKIYEHLSGADHPTTKVIRINLDNVSKKRGNQQ